MNVLKGYGVFYTIKYLNLYQMLFSLVLHKYPHGKSEKLHNIFTEYRNIRTISPIYWTLHSWKQLKILCMTIIS